MQVTNRILPRRRKVASSSAGPIVPSTRSLACRIHTSVVRFFTLCSLGVLALTIAACGGGPAVENFTQRDVVQILNAAPPMPAGSSWTKEGGIEESTFAQLRRALKAQRGHENEIAALADAGLERVFEQGWISNGGASAEAHAALLPDAPGAEKAFAPFQHLTPSWFVPVSVKHLGTEAVSAKGEPGAVYMWRRGNVVFAAWIFRVSARAFDYDRAAREYADKLDERAMTG
jgi:hypothetical protein